MFADIHKIKVSTAKRDEKKKHECEVKEKQQKSRTSQMEAMSSKKRI